ncbi:MAG TPA: hypothetical protein VN612_02065 [Acidobacteriaceae bacterium]|nr:hypothetical protein [Acidobacteriaceae bacterium]
MEIWYRTGALGGTRIDRVEVLNSTEKTVIVAATASGRERRAAIASTYDCYFRTWEEAHAYLLEKAESKVLSARRGLELANSHLGNIRGIKKPA